MHELVRQVRFSVNPFLRTDSVGFNSYGSKPCAEGMSLYFGLWVQVEGPVNEDTGFVVNVTQIDKIVRKFVVPIFDERIKEKFEKGEPVKLSNIREILNETTEVLAGKFEHSRLKQLCLELNPFRKMTVKTKDINVFYFSEKFEFAATHTLWNDKYSNERNFEVFGKCANPTGHGHNYVVEVTIKKSVDNEEICISDFEKIVDTEFISLVDHKNLNVDVENFRDKNPTVENITSFAWDRLKGKFDTAELANITVWETDRTYCSYSGE